MKKKFTLMLIMVLCQTTFAQIFFEDFDNYKVGNYLGLQSSKWTTWSNNPGGSDDVLVDSVKSLSGKNSIYFKSNNINPQDVVLPFGKIYNSGKFRFSSNFYVPKNKAAYFNIQADTTVGVTWSIEFIMNSTGKYTITSGTGVSGSFPQDKWFELSLEIDLDSGVWEVFFDRVSQGSFKNTNTVSQLDLFCSDTVNSEFWVDDVSFCADNACFPEIAMQTVSISPNPVCSFDSADATVKLKNNSRFAAKEMTLGVEVGNQTISKKIGLNYLAPGKDTSFTIKNIFYSKVSGSNTVVKAINLSGDIDAKNDTAKGTINVVASPSNITLGNDTVVCAYNSITLTVPTGLSKYEWSTGGNTETEKIDTTLKNITTGKHNIWLKVTNSTQCSYTDTIVIDFMKSPIINLGADKNLCNGESYSLIGGQIFYNHEWSKVPSTSILSTNNVFSVDSSGVYIAKISTKEGCSNYDTVEIYVHPNPTKPNITTSSNPKICKDDTLKLSAPANYAFYNWSNGLMTEEIQVTDSKKITLIVTDSNGCKSPVSNIIDVIVNPIPAKPTIKINGKTFFCDGDSVELEAPANYANYIWSDGNTSQFNQVKLAGSFTLQVIDSIGCKSPISNSIKTIVYVLPASPVIQIIGDTTFCEGGSVSLSVPAGKQYIWEDGQSTNQRTILSSGTYYVYTRDVNSCISLPSNTVNITVFEKPKKPIVTPGGIIHICAGETVNLSVSTGEAKYFWSDSSHNNSIVVSDDGNFMVKIQDVNGCLSENSDIVKVNKIPLPNKPSISAIGTTKLQCFENAQRYRWFKNGVLIADTIKTIPVSSHGYYQVQISESGCWSQLSDSFNYDFSSVKIIQNLGVQIYPNPTNATINIKVENMNSDMLLEMYDLQGKLVLKTNLILEENQSGKIIDLEKFSAGIYLIKISNLEMVISRKIEKY